MLRGIVEWPLLADSGLSCVGCAPSIGKMLPRRGEGHPIRGPVGNADRAQGLGHRLRNSQAQTLPRRPALLSESGSWQRKYRARWKRMRPRNALAKHTARPLLAERGRSL